MKLLDNSTITKKMYKDVSQIAHLVINNSIVEIEDYALMKKGIKTITFGNKLKRICYQSVDDNEIEELDLPESLEEIYGFAFMRNKIRYVHFKKNIKTVFVSSFYDNPLEILEFDSFPVEIVFKFIEEYSSIKKIIIHEPITVWQFLDIKNKIFIIKRNRQLNITEDIFSFNFECHTPIERLYVDITKKLESIDCKYKKELLASIDTKMLEYASLMREKPTYDEKAEFFSMNKKQAKEDELTRYLESILFKLNAQDNYYELKSRLETLENLLDNEINMPTTFDTVEDKVKYIILIAKNFHNEILITKLKYILALGKNKIDALIMNLDDVSLDQDINLIIEEMLNLLFIKACYFLDNISTFNNVIESLKVNDNRYLSDIFMIIYYFIDTFKVYKHNKISEELDTLRKKFPYLNNFTLDLKVGELASDSKEEIVQFITTFMYFYQNTYPFNKVYEDLYASLYLLKENTKKETKGSIISAKIAEIIAKASLHLSDQDTYEKIKNELNDIISKWLKKIENFGIHILDDSNHYLVKNTNLSKEILVTILIIEELLDIERKMDIYNISYEDYENRQALMK